MDEDLIIDIECDMSGFVCIVFAHVLGSLCEMLTCTFEYVLSIVE